MSKDVHVLGFAGSLRRGSYNRATLRAAGELLPAGMSLEVFDLAPVPLYNWDVEAAGIPESVREFKERITAADALLIATPEYNYSFSGVLKNAIDWATRPSGRSSFDGKPAAIVGASTGTGGTVRSQLHLRQVCFVTNMRVLNKPELLIMQAGEKFDSEGRLTDEPTRRRLQAVLEALAAWTRQLRGDG